MVSSDGLANPGVSGTLDPPRCHQVWLELDPLEALDLEVGLVAGLGSSHGRTDTWLITMVIGFVPPKWGNLPLPNGLPKFLGVKTYFA